MPKDDLDLSPPVSDEVRKTTCYMCACRCGINVHLRDGKVRYIEGNRDHPVNKGVLCAKGSAGIMQHYSPARLKAPMKRVGERGSGKFEEISWDEAYEIAAGWLKPIRETNPSKLAFFTGRDQSQSFTSWWAQMFGTPNYAAHGGFCSVNMAVAGIASIGGAFWEFGSPDWDRTKYFMIFGVAEDHDSNPIKIGLGKLKARGARVVGVNPVRSGYNAIADEWVGITPGTDGLFVLALVHELLRMGRIDVEYLIRYTNLPWLTIDEPGAPDDGLFLRGEDGEPLVATEAGIVSWKAAGKPILHGVSGAARPVKTGFERMGEEYLTASYAPEAVAQKTGVSAETTRRIARELAHVAFEEEIVIDQPWTDFRGVRHEKMVGRPVSFHAMRGISAHSNGFQTCRAIHLLQMLLGSIEVPGGFRFKPPYPKPASAHPRPHTGWEAGKPLDGPHLGVIRGPEDLQINADGSARRIDKAFTWEAPFSAHGLMHMVISNAHAGDPYEIDTLFLYMANMSWNSSMDPRGVMGMLTDKRADGEYKIPHVIYSDAYSSEMVAYADLILPDTTYLERHDCISLLDRPICEPEAAADAIRWPVVEPDRDVKGFQTALVELGVKLGLPGFTDADGNAVYKDYADYMVNHLRRPGVGPLAGFRGADGTDAGRGEVNPDQLDAYIENGGFWVGHIPDEGLYYKPWNTAYQDWAVEVGIYDAPQPYVFQAYLEPLAKFQRAAEGHGEQVPPEHLRERIGRCFTPLPSWYPPFEGDLLDTNSGIPIDEAYPYHALTQRPMAMYHSWGSQNAWLRQIHGHNPLFISQQIANRHALVDGDWVKARSHHGEITVPVKVMAALNPHTVWTWNAIGKRKGAWALEPDAPESEKGFLLNHLIRELLPERGDGLRWANSDPVTGQAAWFDLRISLEKVEAPQEVSLPRDGGSFSPVGKGPSDVAYAGRKDAAD